MVRASLLPVQQQNTASTATTTRFDLRLEGLPSACAALRAAPSARAFAWISNAGTPASPGFVAMFVGHGLVMEAPHTGDVVNVVTCASLTDRGVSTLWRID